MKASNSNAQAILHFYKHIRIKEVLPPGVEVMNPFGNPVTWKIVEQFYERFYNDQQERRFLIGINPGRFGAGITGIPFTDPIRLENACGIPNHWDKKTELSSVFMYNMMDAMGGPAIFFGRYYITSVSPLGFIKEGLNLNYYDDKMLQLALEPFIKKCIQQQLSFPGASTDICYCIGEGTNYKMLCRYNEKWQFFKAVIPLPHPRWVMQYRRKNMADYIELYCKKLGA